MSRAMYLLKYTKESLLSNYNSDGLKVWHKNVAFLHEPRFAEAYRQGMDSGHKIGRGKGSKRDLHIEWRVHVICWAASLARQLPGDFVECGVNTGIYSLAACHFIDFNRTGKQFFLFDTFAGIPEEQISEDERQMDRVHQNSLFYEDCFEVAKRNFAPYPKAVLVRGRIPETLPGAGIRQVCYLSLDLNCAEPEIAAIRFFWDLLVPGAPVVLDDYGSLGYVPQKVAMDAFAAEVNVPVLTLPTGQGLIIKPPPAGTNAPGE
jgi:O-methyltransferase